MNRISLTEPLICIPETITTLKINGNSIFLKSGDFSGGPVDKNQPPKGEDSSSIPSLGRFHMQQGIYSHTLELLNPHALESVLCNKSVPTIRSHPTATRESLHLAPKTQGSKKWMNKFFLKRAHTTIKLDSSQSHKNDSAYTNQSMWPSTSTMEKTKT